MFFAFLIVAGLLIYVFGVFPTTMMVVARRPSAGRAPGPLPPLTVLIAARNEAEGIVAKLDNTLQSDYPDDLIKIIVGSDGSLDGTDDKVLGYHDRRVSLLRLAGRGKTQTVNALLEAASTEVVVLTDADVLVAPDAIRRLAAHFSAPEVDVVCGRRSDCGEERSSVSWPARLYNLYEGAIKRGEGRLGCTLGGDGCLYALRRQEGSEPLPPHVPDDFVNALRALARGACVRYEELALSWEALPSSSRQEFTRKRRTVARGIRGLWSVRQLLNPVRYPLVSFLLVSHKVLRWEAHLLLIALLVLNSLLVSSPAFAVLLCLQCGFYLAVPLGRLSPRSPLTKPFRMIRYFVMTNVAAAAALADILRGKDWSVWSTPGSAPADSTVKHATPSDN